MVVRYFAVQQLQYHFCPDAQGNASYRVQALLTMTVPQHPLGSPALDMHLWKLRKAAWMDPSGRRTMDHSSA